MTSSQIWAAIGIERGIALAVAAALLAAGLTGVIGAASGYGLFLIATLLILIGVLLTAIFFLTRRFDAQSLKRSIWTALTAGGWSYVFAVAVLSGYFVRETLEGRMEAKWIVFGPSALAAIILLDWGIYHIIVKRNIPTLQRYGEVFSREKIDPRAMRKTLAEEVVLHRSLFSVSPFRWVRHQLILWGFALMFAVELAAVAVREAFPAFGLTDVWRIPGHPVRLAFDFAFDVTGLMILIGCLLALVFRWMAHGTPEQKYTDTPTTVFLFVVVVSGFVLEGLRMALSADQPGQAASFVGLLFAGAIRGIEVSPRFHEGFWYFHALLSCAFIAYVPVKRLIHSCATPLGRMMNSQKAMLAAKKERVLRGLLGRGVIATPVVTENKNKRV